jgi:hypothetical protein
MSGISPLPLDGGRRKSAWNKHVAKFHREHPKLSMKQAMKKAAKTWKKVKRGGTLMGKGWVLGGTRRRSRSLRGGNSGAYGSIPGGSTSAKDVYGAASSEAHRQAVAAATARNQAGGLVE